MKKKATVLIASIMAFCGINTAHADEGMWTIYNLPNAVYEMMQREGFSMTYDQLYNGENALKNAVVNFSGYCSGVVVSPDGLVFTNHHCGFEAIRSHSTVEHDYMLNGFFAKSYAEELPNENMFVSFMVEQKDVTDKVMSLGYEKLDNKKRDELIDSLENEMTKEVKKNDSTLHITVQPFYEGNKWYATTYRDFTDLRLVFTVPKSMGKFGGDTDNWMWPRQTCDFSVFRIYADPKTNGPAAYSKDNVPYHPKRWAQVSLQGYKDGDYAMTMGYPGSTERYLSSYGIQTMRDAENAPRAQVRGVKQEVMQKHMRADEAVRIKYDSKYASSSNYWKNAIGMNEGLVRLKVLDTKRAQQEALLARGRSLNDNSYQQAFDQIRAIVKQRRPALYHQQAIQEALVTGLDFMRIPSTAGLVSALKNKDKKQIAAAKDSLQKAADRYFASVPFPEVERIVGKEMLKIYMKYIPAEQRIGIFQIIDKRFKGNSDAFIDACFEHSIFGNKENFAKFIRKPSLYKINTDWMVLLKYSITDGLLQTSIAMMDANKNYNAAHKVWVKGMMDMKLANGQPIYPDANSTLRLTYGQVLPYAPADGVKYDYYTTLKGAMEKEDPDNWEFVVPAKLKQLYQAKDFGRYAMPNGEMPICFIVNTDNTGGNSGSPVFNAKGELIGTGFDRNYEGLTGDIAFRPSSQRAACVDIRYTLFIIDKYAGASHLIEEMTIK